MSVKTNMVQLLAVLAPLVSASVAPRDFPRPKFGSVPYGAQITSCSSPGKIALTFDDGPSIYTEGIVNILEANGARGTFFITGSNGESGLENTQFHSVVKRVVAAGHQVGHHTWSHPHLGDIGQAGIISEVTQLENLFISVLGFTPTYFRPPYTECDSVCYSTLGDLGYHVTDYDLDTLDWDPSWPHKEKYFEAMAGTSPATTSKVVLSHDIQEFTGTTDFVQYMIDVARAQGFTQFVTLGECLGDDPANWYRDPTTGGPVGSKPPPTTTPNNPTTTPPTTQPTSTPTRYTNTTITRTDTTLTTVCPYPTTHTPNPTGCKGKTCQSTSYEPHPGKSTKTRSSATPSGTKPPTVTVNAAVAPAAGVAHVVGASLFGLLAWMVL